MSSARVLVWIPTGDHGWEIEPARQLDSVWIGGGLRTLHELAVAIACTGREVEMRGAVHAPTLDALADAAGARPELPERPRELTAADTVILPEGTDDPAVYARLSLSPARAIVAVLAAPGLIGWPFVPGWSRPDPLIVPIDSLARPEHFRGAAALGLELWTHSPGLQAAANAAGVECRFLGNGSPLRFPDPPPAKDIDVVTLRDARWWPLAKPVVRRLADRGIDCVPVPTSDNEHVLEVFGRARILLHPSRVEGHSRVGCEARAMGAVPVVPDTNPFAVGLDEAGGSLALPADADTAGAIAGLLADPDRLARLSATAVRTARKQVEWEPFLARVEAALASPPVEPARLSRGAAGAALRGRAAAAGTPPATADQTQVERALAVLNDALVAGREDLERHRLWLQAMERSLSWRLTAPLRAERGGSSLAARLEALIPVARREPAPAAGNGPPPSGFFAVPRGRIDAPAEGGITPRRPIRMRGWSLFPGSAVARVDVVVGSSPAVQARLGIDRLDLASATTHAHAPVCGFELIVDLTSVPAQQTAVTIEAVAHALDGRRLRLAPVTVALEPPFVQNTGAPPALDAPATDGFHPPRTPGHPTRLLAFSHELAYGGASLYLAEVLQRLHDSGDFDVSVVSFADGPLRERLERGGIAVHLTGAPQLASPAAYEGRLAELAAWVRTQDADVALVNALASFPGADVAQRLGIPVVWSIHDSLEPRHFWVAAYPPGTAHPYVLARVEEALAQATALVFPARATELLFAPYVDAQRLITLPYGIGFADIDAARRLAMPQRLRRTLGIPADAMVILCLGSIEARKSQAMLAQAFAQVAHDHPSAHLLLVGKADPSGPYVDGIAQFAARAGLGDRIHIEPTTENPHAFHLIADVLVCASDLESLPRSIVEATAFETPVLSTRVFGVPELVEDGRTGLLCTPRDASALAQGLDRVLSAAPADLRAMAAEGAERVRLRHDPERAAAELAAILTGAAGLRHESAGIRSTWRSPTPTT